MARRKRKNRRKALHGLGMETPAGYLTVEGKPKLMLTPERSGAGGLVVTVLGLAALAGAGYLGWRWWQGRNTPRQMTEAEAAAGGV